jgi:hypothetical protein
MPLARDAKGGGSNADGTKNTQYCSHCYEQGRFTLPDLTAEQMQQRVGARLRSIGMPDAQVQGLVAMIPRLQRWVSART